MVRIRLAPAESHERTGLDELHRGGAFQHPEQLPPVGPRAAHLLLICLSASVPAQLLKLGVERLPLGADAGIAEAAGFGGWLGLSFQVGSGHTLWKP